MMRIMFGDFGFQYRAIRDVGRVGNQQVDATVQVVHEVIVVRY